MKDLMFRIPVKMNRKQEMCEFPEKNENTIFLGQDF